MDNNVKALTFGSIQKDLYFNKKVSISFDSVEFDPTADLKVLVQIEPPTIVSTLNATIIDNKDNFDLILTWHPNILSKCNNSELFVFGDCWIDEKDRVIHKKTKMLSIIASSKQQTEGHRLRHQIINKRIVSMDTFGRGYNPIDNKIIGLKDYMFSLIIENDNTDNWVTEKIIDCLVTGTIPVYWGCSNIGDYFNTKGFIQFKNITESNEILPQLNEDKYYNMLPFVKENYNLSFNYTDFWGRIKQKINEKL
jgi:hypothetical protein|tara:strand:+ start:6711 stop:7466 length:756 start_codon:yes stop_codon:yes gene_type:complete